LDIATWAGGGDLYKHAATLLQKHQMQIVA
jgi:hypothetical protein